MPTEHTERSPKSDVPSTSELLPSVDPLRLLWVVTAGALAVILAYLHFYPQAANPMHGITPALGIVMLVGASVLIVARLADVGVRPFIPMLLPCALVLWAAWRTSRAAVPSEGVALLGTMLEATLVFAISLVLTVAAREWKSFSFQLASGTSKGLRLLTSADLTRGKTDKPRPGSRDLSEAEPPRLFLDTVISFFLILAVIMCLWAIWQYFVSYDRQLVEFERDIKARGFALADLPSREWALLQALRGKRVGSLFGNPNVLAGFLAMVAPMALAGAAIWNDRSAKAAALAVLTSCWYVAVLSGSRGGLLTIALATALAAVVMGREAWRKQRRVLLIASALCAIAVVLALATERTSAARPVPTDSAPLPTARYTFFERLHGARTVRQRIYYLQSGWAMIRKSPLLGQGLGSYAALYPQHKRPMARETRYPHNIICHLWVETGLVGLGLWVAWIAVTGAVVIGRLRAVGGGPRNTVTRLLLVGAGAFIFNNLFEMTWAFREAYLDWSLLMGVIAGLGAKTETVRDRPCQSTPHTRPHWLKMWAPQALTATPLVVGLVLANSVLLCPLMAAYYQDEANKLLPENRAGKWDDEIQRLAFKMIRYQPRSPWYHSWLASFYRDKGRWAESKDEFEKARQLHPFSASILSEYAEMERLSGRTDEARRLLVEAKDIYPLNAEIYYRLARLEREARDAPEARKWIEQAQQINAPEGIVLDARLKTRFDQFTKELDSPTSPSLPTS